MPHSCSSVGQDKEAKNIPEAGDFPLLKNHVSSLTELSSSSLSLSKRSQAVEVTLGREPLKLSKVL